MSNSKYRTKEKNHKEDSTTAQSRKLAYKYHRSSKKKNNFLNPFIQESKSTFISKTAKTKEKTPRVKKYSNQNRRKS